jgi:hypothetical protein
MMVKSVVTLYRDPDSTMTHSRVQCRLPERTGFQTVGVEQALQPIRIDPAPCTTMDNAKEAIVKTIVSEFARIVLNLWSKYTSPAATPVHVMMIKTQLELITKKESGRTKFKK